MRIRQISQQVLALVRVRVPVSVPELLPLPVSAQVLVQ